MTIELQSAASERRHAPRSLGVIAAPVAAIFYPFALQAFNAAALAVPQAEAPKRLLLFAAAAFALAAAFAIPLGGLLAALRYARVAAPTAAQRRGEIVALVVVAAPAIYTFLGVVDYMASSPVADEWIFGAFYVALAIFATAGGSRAEVRSAPPPAPALLRAAHGVAAGAVLCLFLGSHLVNHLAGLVGPEAHRALMKSLRVIYGSAIAEPAVVALMLFLVGSGFWLARRRLQAKLDSFGVLQIAAGVYLLFFVLGHMNSVFIFARTWSQPPIATDWSFATSEAWGGLIASGWSNRLIPHYWFGAFFAIAHVAAGLRGVLLAHGATRRIADRLLFGGVALGLIVATAILSGMCGLRLGV